MYTVLKTPLKTWGIDVYEKASLAHAQGVSYDDYFELQLNKHTFISDKDEDNKAIPYTEKGKKRQTLFLI